MGREKITVLLIEDERVSAELVRHLLEGAEDADFAVEHVTTLAGGLARLASPGVDVVLLDLLLPNGEGLEVVRRVCSEHPEVPVVVITGLEDSETALAAIRECAQDYLVKGQFDARDLIRAVRFAIERHKVKVRFQGVYAALQEAAQTVGQLQALDERVRKKA